MFHIYDSVTGSHTYVITHGRTQLHASQLLICLTVALVAFSHQITDGICLCREPATTHAGGFSRQLMATGKGLGHQPAFLIYGPFQSRAGFKIKPPDQLRRNRNLILCGYRGNHEPYFVKEEAMVKESGPPIRTEEVSRVYQVGTQSNPNFSKRNRRSCVASPVESQTLSTSAYWFTLPSL